MYDSSHPETFPLSQALVKKVNQAVGLSRVPCGCSATLTKQLVIYAGRIDAGDRDYTEKLHACVVRAGKVIEAHNHLNESCK